MKMFTHNVASSMYIQFQIFLKRRAFQLPKQLKTEAFQYACDIATVPMHLTLCFNIDRHVALCHQGLSPLCLSVYIVFLNTLISAVHHAELHGSCHKHNLCFHLPIIVCLHVHVCTHVCVHVCTHVHVHVCVHECTHVRYV